MKNIQKILLIITVALFLPFSNNFSQEIIITKKGQVFSCKIDTIENDSLYYTFELSGKLYSGMIAISEISYSGKNFISGDTMINKDIENYPDLIITKKGDIYFCKIKYVHIHSITYLFSANGNQLENEIIKKYVAHYSRNYKNQFDLEKESIAYFKNILKDIDSFREISPKLTKIEDVETKIEDVETKIEHVEAKIEEDSSEFKKDLILKKTGEKLICKVDGIGISYVKYSFSLHGKVYNNYIDKNEINYIINDFLTKSDTVLMVEEKIAVENIVPDYDFSDLIITIKHDLLECSIIHVGSNTIEYGFEKNGTTYSGIIEKNEVIYYGKNFVESMDEKDNLKNDTYNDLIYTNKNNTLLCNIENVNKSIIEYSFLINNIKLFNTIERKDVIYFGINFFNNPQIEEPQFTVETEIKKEDKVDTGERKTIDNIPPKVIIISPELASKDTFKVVPAETVTITLSGLINDSSEIRDLLVNNIHLPVSENGYFNKDIELQSGMNEIILKATDIHSNSILRKYFIEKSKPIQVATVRMKKDVEPPVIKLYSPRFDNDITTKTVGNKTKQIRVFGNVQDESGVYEVVINGQDAALSSSGDFSLDVYLRIGENNIDVQATDLKSNSSRQTFVINREDVDIQMKEPLILEGDGKYYGLLMGVSNYADPAIPDLDDQPVDDVKKLYQVLKENYMFDEQNLKLLINPNRVDILKTFDRLSKAITSEDNLLIFFAGHGYYDTQTELGYWLPSDAEVDFTANWIYNDVLVANLKRIQSKHTLLISDACFSGSIFKTRSFIQNAPLAYKKKYDLKSRKAITSGVLKTVPNKSVFFEFLLDRLETNQELYMSASELFRSIEIPVANNSPNSPQYGDIQNVGDEGGDFIFIRNVTW